MVKIYVSLIKKGLRTFESVPVKLKEQVQLILIEEGCANLTR